MKLSSQDDIVNSLKSIGIFSSLSHEKLQCLVNDCKEISLEGGEILFREGDLGDSMFVVLSGALSVEKENTMIAHRSQGDHFGEMTLIEGKPRSATLIAISKSRVLEIGKDQFQIHFASNPQVLMTVLKTVSERAREDLVALDQGMRILRSEKKTNAGLKDLLNDTLNEIYIFDSETYHFIKMNSRALRNLGYEKGEIAQMSPFDVIAYTTKEFFVELTKPLRAGKKQEVVYKGEHQRKDGSTYPVEIHFKLQTTETPPVFVGIAQDMSQVQELEDKNSNLTFYDSLTGLPNKKLILEHLNSELATENRKNKSIAVLLLDLDDFKVINDSMGLQAGDKILKTVTERLLNWAPPDCRVGRYGGDEFIVILSGINFETEAAKAASELLRLIYGPFPLCEQEVFVTISIGLSYHPLDGHEGEILIKHAETAMHSAKENGKNTYRHYISDMEDQAKNKLTLEQDLRNAVEREQFELYYQPKLDLDSETIIGFEALVRWNHPRRGVVSPMEFIPLAEKTRLINPLGEWVLRTACQQIKTWQDMGLPFITIAVNLSAHQFNQSELVETIIETLKDIEIHPEYLELEITESVLMENTENAADQLRQLNSLGIKISIDDFGTGYSSLNYLNSFPLNNLKVDRAFVKDITSEKDATLAKAIVSLANALNLKTIAEGVETEVQKEVLRSIGCNIIQGYLLSKPLPADEATQLISSS